MATKPAGDPGVASPAVQYLPFAVTIPAGTAIANAITTPLAIGDVFAHNVEVMVPKGPNGHVGFAITYAGTQLIPWGPAGTWLIVDQYDNVFDLGVELGASLGLVGYNVGNYPHTVYLRFAATPIAEYLAGAQPAGPALVAL